MSVIVIMGVAGSGKSLVAARLADRLAVPFCEGDDLHPAANIARMHAGIPLDDAARAPWLARVAAWIGEHPAGGVVTCSALRRGYRDRLRQDQAVVPSFVLLDPSRAVLARRLAARHGHFMPASLLDSQLATLEPPGPDEHPMAVDVAGTVAEIADDILRRIGAA